MFPILLGLIIILIAILVSGFFSASETALMAFRAHRVPKDCRAEHLNLIKSLLKYPDRLLSVILLGNTFCNIFASSMVTMLASQYGGQGYTLLASFLLTLVILIFAEIMPKTLAAFYPEKLSVIVVPILHTLMKALYPLIYVVNQAAKKPIAWLRLQQPAPTISKIQDEIRALIYQNRAVIEPDYRLMLLGLLDLIDLNVNDIMVPKHQLKGLDLTQPWSRTAQALMRSTHTLCLIYRQSLDEIVGVVNWKKLSQSMHAQTLNQSQLLAACDPVGYIPEGVCLSKQLFLMKNNPCQIQIVVNEFGGTMGMVRPEDLIEEVIGEYLPYVHSVHSLIKKLPSGDLCVPGTINIRDLNRYLKTQLALPADAVTLSGALIEYLEMIPIGPFSIQIGDYRLQINQITEQNIETVWIRRYGVKKSEDQIHNVKDKR